jgi:flavin reductase (DIM6/NTAB) family NADH-FMN oxidoreductase RutF
VFYEPHERPRDVLPHDPFKALVAPRPVGWISTRDAGGVPNLAPYSFFNAVCDHPPMVAFSSAGMKHSATNALATGEFVWNLATYALREAMNESSAVLPAGASEFDRARLTPAACRLVAAPRVAESPCSLECRVVHAHELTALDGAGADHHLVVGQVVGVHLDDAAVRDGRVRTDELRPIARCGYLGEYAVVDALFELRRPPA